jgi:ATP-dependent Clp protease protease subunit
MSIRTLPELPALERRPEVGFDLAPKALAAWDAGVVAAAASDQDTISILEQIGADFFTDGVTAKRVSAALRSIGPKPVTVIINSPGGDFFEGLAIYNLLRNHPKAVTVQIIGIAASAAAVVAMAGDDIQIAKAGLLMVHNSQWFAIGDRHVMSETADQMATFDQAMRGVFVDRSGLNDKEVGAMMDATTFLGSDEAIAKGFADELLPADAVGTDASAALHERPAAYRIEAALAKCGVPRADRRKLIREFIEVTPGADLNGTPGAADCDEGLAHLRAAAMGLSLT